MIKLNHFSFSYIENRTILDDLTFHIQKGEKVGLIGCNGAGKSTLLKTVIGIEDGQGGLQVAGMTMNNQNLASIRSHIGYVFQDSDNQLFMSSVYEDVAFGPMNEGLQGKELEERINNALDLVHMQEKKHEKIYRLSGGEKKRAAIATVLSMRPDILLFDEPSVSLDPRHRRGLINVVNELPYTMLIASHDLDFIYDTCDRVLLLSDGKLVADGLTQEILTNKKLLEDNGLELPLSFIRVLNDE